jgi:hypothetical protein
MDKHIYVRAALVTCVLVAGALLVVLFQSDHALAQDNSNCYPFIQFGGETNLSEQKYIAAYRNGNPLPLALG